MVATSKNVVPVDPQRELILANVGDLISRIPMTGGDGTGFILDVLNAESAASLVGEDEGSSAVSAEDVQGHNIRVDSVMRWTSDKYDPEKSITDQYLIVFGYDRTDGEDVIITVGAATPIVKLAKLHAFGAFPADVRFKPASKPTAQGFYPMNMSILSVTERETVDA